MNSITVVEINIAGSHPPVPTQRLLRLLLKKGYRVNFIGGCLSNMPEEILSSPKFLGYEIPYKRPKSVLDKVKYRVLAKKLANRYMRECMKTSDVLWTASMASARVLGKNMLKYKNVLQLTELAEHGYLFKSYIRFPIEEYARKSWKTVVCEINRAYIQQVWWDLPQRPYVLPNKPFNLDPGRLTPDVEVAIEKMKREKKKIVLYLGGIYADRSFEECAKAICESGEYVFYLAGQYYTDSGKRVLDHLSEKYGAVYLGVFHPPMHLALVSYAKVGLLPYKPVKGGSLSELNALYCAPNKIFEYAGFGVPMVGSDVLGLRLPFEKWNIGCCCDFCDVKSIFKAIREVDREQEEMSRNCREFYDSVNLDEIVSEILED